MLRLYDHPASGNGYKVRLALAHLKIPFVYVPVDIYAGAAKAPEFLARNPAGQIPVLEFADGWRLPESNAILAYLAEGTSLWPAERRDRAEALRWMFWEQYSHEPNVAVARSWTRRSAAPSAAALEDKRAKGRAALAVMDGHLRRRDWFAGDAFSAADIALYAYTHVAPEGGIALDPYPAVRAWLARVARQPGHVTIDHDFAAPAAAF